MSTDTTPSEATGRSGGGLAARTLLPPIVVAMAVLAVWLILTYLVLTGSQRFMLPPPHEVAQGGLFTWLHLSTILAGTWSTTQVIVLGLILAIVIGVAIATAMSQARWVERTLFPYAVVVQAVPIVAVVPLIRLWFGAGFNSRVIVTVIIAVFPVITNTLFGLRSAAASQHDLFTLHGASRWTRLRKLQFPAAIPAIFTGFRISAGLAVIGAIVGDFFFRKGQLGLGGLLSTYQFNLQAKQLITAIFFASLLGLALFALFSVIGNRLTRDWDPSVEMPQRGAKAPQPAST